MGGGGGAFIVAKDVVVCLFSWAIDIGVKFLGVEVVELGDRLGGRAGASVGLVWWVLCALDLDAIARIYAVVKYAAFGNGDVFQDAAFEEAAFFKNVIWLPIELRATFLELAVDKEAAFAELALGEEGAVFKINVVFEGHAGAECTTHHILHKWHSVFHVLYCNYHFTPRSEK